MIVAATAAHAPPTPRATPTESSRQLPAETHHRCSDCCIPVAAASHEDPARDEPSAAAPARPSIRNALMVVWGPRQRAARDAVFGPQDRHR